MEPTRVGSYTIESKLGAGGMGTVYLGRHVESGEPAAVKVLPASLAREEGFVARFTREIEAMKQLTNPHVVRLYESGVDNETYYYVMEYVEGETLTARLRRDKRIPWRETIDIALQICSALKAAHDAGIVHRDLKPSNLLLAPDGTVKLTDFGVAQVFAGGKLTVTGGIIGTAEYMSPEQAQGSRATKKSDLYSLGAVMYAMLTGRPPFSGKSTLEVIQKHKFNRFDRPSLFTPDLPHWLEEIVCQLLEKDPEKRPADAFVLSRRLQEVVRKVEVSSQEQTVAGGATSVGTAETIAAGGGASGPGAGTLMRDLVRAEIEQQNQPSPLGQLFNNTWVLVGLLVLVILGGVAWFQSRELSPEQRFAAGVELMQDGEGPNWLRARDEYFLPLVKDDPKRWEPEVQEYLDQIHTFELKSGTRPRLLRLRSQPRSEPERLLKLATAARDDGDLARAERTLVALVTLLDGREEYAAVERAAEELLAELRTERTGDAAHDSFLNESLKRAEALAADGQRAEARDIWSSIVELYASDPSAAPFVERAQAALADQMTTDRNEPQETIALP